MDTERVLAESERGIHLLFDNPTIVSAYAQDPDRLERALLTEGYDLQAVVDDLLRQPTAVEGRCFIEGLSPDLRHILVLVYFELLDGRLTASRVLH
jgi:hypothetical protein